MSELIDFVDDVSKKVAFLIFNDFILSGHCVDDVSY